MNDGSSSLSSEQRAALRRAARNGEYHLMLGAGASRDSKSSTGVLLPGSGDLITQLCSEFRTVFEEGDQLWRIYDRAVETAGRDAVYSWLRNKFWNVTQPYWMEFYARSPWHTVWTLNVDDTFEKAHAAVATETSRSVVTLNWDDDFRQSRALNIVHLHGVVDRVEPRELVFSLSEYASSAATAAAWPTNFRDTYGNSPFVILGARLRDEPDIEAVISRRRPTHSAPSFYVAQFISAATRQDLERWGLIPVEMTAEDFVVEWASLSGLELDQTLDSELELGMRLGQQFTELRTNVQEAPIEGHDFLGGDEPVWGDIRGGLAAELEWVTKAKMDCGQVGQSIASATLLAYTGRRLTGRSTGLYQVGKFLRERSWRTFIFREGGRVDVDAVLRFSSDGRSVALLFDGMADVSDDIDRLLSEARSAGLNIICVAVDDLHREANIVGRLKSSNLAHGRVGSINGRLTRTDAARLVDTLARVGRLGIIENKTDAGRLQHFRNKDLFDSMAQLESAPGFGRRVDDLLSPIDDQWKIDVVLVAAYASLVSHQLLVIDAARMAGISSDELVRRIESDFQLSTLLSSDGTRVRARHRWMALKPIVARLGPSTSANVIRDGVRRVSVRLSQQSLRERNPTALLVGSFMAQSNLRTAFPEANLDTWYESLLDVFGSWSARYWEQRAILARRESRIDISLLAKAESFALRAAELVPDAYSFTTLGTVLFEKAARAAVDVNEYYQRGVVAFDRATAMEGQSNTLITWIAFLRYGLRVLRRLRSEIAAGDDRHRELLELVENDWMRAYAQLATVRSTADRVERDLSALRREYEALQSAVSI
ncbi:SIR2 family protein [uncultured Microbacterium sp.]|uniref:P-loop NTPase n=1 Tax=uncultured Microbacterium sp. TaxID=191216 RepID=UPI0025D9BCE9|nr:SIR2 family protein [uncultured Microbacterium sp.]